MYVNAYVDVYADYVNVDVHADAEDRSRNRSWTPNKPLRPTSWKLSG